MKVFLIVLICVPALILLALAAFGISYKLHSSASTEALGKEETVYTTKENGCRIANIRTKNILRKRKPKNTEMPSEVTGIKGHSVKNITLKGFDISYRDTEQNLSVRKDPDEKSMDGYPEITRVSHIYFISHQYSKYWSLPCYGLYSRNAENLTVRNFNCKKRTSDTRDCYCYENNI